MVVLQEALRRLVSQKCILGREYQHEQGLEDIQRCQYRHKKSGMDPRDSGLQKALKRASQKKFILDGNTSMNKILENTKPSEG